MIKIIIGFPILKLWIHSLLYVYFCSAQFRPRAAIHKLRSGWSPGWSREWSGLELGTRRPGDQPRSSQQPPGSQPVCSELILVYCFIATLMKCIKRNARSPSNAEMQGPVECFFLVFTTEAELNAAFAGNYLAVPRRRSENKIPRNGNNCLNVIQFYFYSFYDKV